MVFALFCVVFSDVCASCFVERISDSIERPFFARALKPQLYFVDLCEYSVDFNRSGGQDFSWDPQELCHKEVVK